VVETDEAPMAGTHTHAVLARLGSTSSAGYEPPINPNFATSDRALTGSKENSKKEQKSNERSQAEASGSP
jgi:hypothetical protein